MSAHLYTEEQRVVGGLQPPLSLLQLADLVLISLQLADVVHRRLQDGPFVPPGVPARPITGLASSTHDTLTKRRRR